MGLPTYTTSIDVNKTLGEIQAMLSRARARSITVDYDGDGNPTAVSFVVQTSGGERAFELPANIESVWKTLTEQYRTGQVQRRFTTREQAARVGWRIVRNWLEMQLAMIEVGMASLEQVMLPYVLMDSGKTLYAELVGRGWPRALPAAGQASH